MAWNKSWTKQGDAQIRPCECLGRREGNVVHVWETPGMPLFPFTLVIGPDWGCNLVTWGLLVVPSVLFLVFAAWRIHLVILVVGWVLFGLTAGILALTGLSDPGYMSKQTRAQLEDALADVRERGVGDDFVPCEHCNILRDRTISHCYACDRCVKGLDHHCPWHGKCIAQNNLAFFYAFMFGICGMIGFIAISLFLWAINI